MKKKNLLVGGIIAVAFFAIFFYIANMFSLFEHIERPEIKSGEFDFSLVYDLEGEKGKIEGTYVCEFDKVVRAVDGYGRKWKGYIKGRDNHDCTYIIKETEEGVIKLDLDMDPMFFMSDPNYKSNENTNIYKPEPECFIELSGSYEGEEMSYYSLAPIGDDQFRIIEFNYDAPVENTYK